MKILFSVISICFIFFLNNCSASPRIELTNVSFYKDNVEVNHYLKDCFALDQEFPPITRGVQPFLYYAAVDVKEGDNISVQIEFETQVEFIYAQLDFKNHYINSTKVDGSKLFFDIDYNTISALNNAYEFSSISLYTSNNTAITWELREYSYEEETNICGIYFNVEGSVSREDVYNKVAEFCDESNFDMTLLKYYSDSFSYAFDCKNVVEVVNHQFVTIKRFYHLKYEDELSIEELYQTGESVVYYEATKWFSNDKNPVITSIKCSDKTKMFYGKTLNDSIDDINNTLVDNGFIILEETNEKVVYWDDYLYLTFYKGESDFSKLEVNVITTQI